MSAQVLDRDEISINGLLYKTTGDVRVALGSQYPGKLTIGDYADVSNPRASEKSYSDWQGGILVEVGDPAKDQDRAFFGDVQLRFNGHLLLPRLATLTNGFPSQADVNVLIEYNNTEFATAGTAVHSYNNTTDSWGSSLETMAAAGTDGKVGLLYPSGTATSTLVIANGSGVVFSTNGTDFTANVTQAIKYVIFQGGLLWGITQAGRLYYTNDLAGGATTWTADAQLELPDDYVTGLEVARAPDREMHIYAMTKVGPHIHNRDEETFLETEADVPFHNDGSKGHKKWRGSINFSAGNAIYKFQIGDPTGILVPIGLDQDHGLPTDKRGIITVMEGSHNDLLAGLDASSAAGLEDINTRVSRGVQNHHGVTFNTKQGFSMIAGRNERGWEVKWLSEDDTRSITAMNVSNAYSTYRLWWAHNQRVYHMILPIDVVNPLVVPTSTYALTGQLITPWFDAGRHNQLKLALSLILETSNPTANETVKIEYAINRSDTFVDLVTQTLSGEQEYRLPGVNISTSSVADSTSIKADGHGLSTGDVVEITGHSGSTPSIDGTRQVTVTDSDNFTIDDLEVTVAGTGGSVSSRGGIVFRSIRFRISLARGSTNTNTPDMYHMTLVWRPRMKSLFAPAVQLDLTKAYKGRQVIEMFEDLRDAIDNGPLVEVTWTDEANHTRNYLMDIEDMQTNERTGEIEYGKVNVVFAEPIQTTKR